MFVLKSSDWTIRSSADRSDSSKFGRLPVPWTPPGVGVPVEATFCAILQDFREWRVRRRSNLGRPEASLVGVQYIAFCNGFPFGPYEAKDMGRLPGSSRELGSDEATFGHGGIEIDAAAAPRLATWCSWWTSPISTGRDARRR